MEQQVGGHLVKRTKKQFSAGCSTSLVFSSLDFVQSKRGNAVFLYSAYLVPVGQRPTAQVCLRI